MLNNFSQMSHLSHVTFPIPQEKKITYNIYNILNINNLCSFYFFREIEILGNVTCDKCDICE